MVDAHIFYKNVLLDYFHLFTVHIKEKATNQCDLDKESKARARLFLVLFKDHLHNEKWQV